jgi:hypothetical protein
MMNPTLRRSLIVVVQIVGALLIAAALLMFDVVRVRPAY